MLNEMRYLTPEERAAIFAEKEKRFKTVSYGHNPLQSALKSVRLYNAMIRLTRKYKMKGSPNV